MKNVFAFAALLAVLSVSATAQVITATPSAMNFQGRLAKPDGTPVPDGTYTLTFHICDAQTGGNVKWAEQIGSLNTKNGVFSAILGKVFPFTDARTQREAFRIVYNSERSHQWLGGLTPDEYKARWLREQSTTKED